MRPATGDATVHSAQLVHSHQRAIDPSTTMPAAAERKHQQDHNTNAPHSSPSSSPQNVHRSKRRLPQNRMMMMNVPSTVAGGGDGTRSKAQGPSTAADGIWTESSPSTPPQRNSAANPIPSSSSVALEMEGTGPSAWGKSRLSWFRINTNYNNNTINMNPNGKQQKRRAQQPQNQQQQQQDPTILSSGRKTTANAGVRPEPEDKRTGHPKLLMSSSNNTNTTDYVGGFMESDGIAKTNGVPLSLLSSSPLHFHPPLHCTPKLPRDRTPATTTTSATAAAAAFVLSESDPNSGTTDGGGNRSIPQRVQSWMAMGHFSSRFSGNDTNTNNALEIKLDDDDNDEEDYSLRDFDDSEWTPADSSYGAAIPLAGWIPKGLRRSMEWTVIAAVAAMIVVLIVRTSLRAGDNRNSNSNNGVKRYINNDDYDNDDGSIWAYNISNTATDDNDAMDD